MAPWRKARLRWACDARQLPTLHWRHAQLSCDLLGVDFFCCNLCRFGFEYLRGGSFPLDLKIERVPQGTHSKNGAFEYESRYTFKGQELKVLRVFTSRRASPVCSATDDKDWLAYRRVLQQDLRAQVFFR
jgi:hypothetical protein